MSRCTVASNFSAEQVAQIPEEIIAQLAKKPDLRTAADPLFCSWGIEDCDDCQDSAMKALTRRIHLARTA